MYQASTAWGAQVFLTPAQLHMGQDFDTWGGHGMGFEIIAAIEEFPGGQAGIDAGASQEVEGDFCLGECLIPEVYGKGIIHGCPPS